MKRMPACSRGPAWRCAGSPSRVHTVRCKAVSSTRTSETGSLTGAACRVILADSAPEQVGLRPLIVQGEIPAWLAGDLYKTGPGVNKGYDHFFDGLAMLVHFQFGAGQVAWQQRMLDTHDYRAYQQTGRPQYMAFAHKVGVVQHLFSVMKQETGLGVGVTDNASVTLHPSAGSTAQGVALSETAEAAYSVDRATLRTVQQFKLPPGSPVRGNLPNAHPKPVGGGYSVSVRGRFPDGRIEVARVRLGDDTHAGEVLYDLPVSNARGLNPWMHDAAVSEHYLALVEQPLYFTMPKMLGLAPLEPYAGFGWHPEDGVTITVLRLDGSGTERVFTMPAWFSFHFVNTWEHEHAALGRCLVIDVPVSEDPSQIDDLFLAQMRNLRGNITPLHLKRVFLPLDGDGPPVVEDLMRDHSSYGEYAELPCMNPAHHGKPYRFFYAGSVRRPSPFINRVTKFDVVKGRPVAHWECPGGAPMAEPKFVARPGGTAEDDGVVLQTAADEAGRTMVAVLDARDLRELARAYTEQPFLLGFHSTFLE